MDELSEFIQKIEKVAGNYPQYKIEAYSFVLAGLNYTVREYKRPRHITGAQLCEGIRDFAKNQFGPLTKCVLEYWGIHCTRDFGEIVFALIQAGLMSKTDEDRVADFEDVYDFEQVFCKEYSFDVDELDLSFAHKEPKQSDSGGYN